MIYIWFKVTIITTKEYTLNDSTFVQSLHKTTVRNASRILSKGNRECCQFDVTRIYILIVIH